MPRITWPMTCLLVVGACLSFHGESSADDAPFRWKFAEGQRRDYVIEFVAVDSAGSGANEAKSTTTMTIDASTTVKKRSGASAEIVLKIERLRVKAEIEGKTMTFDSSSNEKASDELEKMLGKLCSLLPGAEFTLSVDERGAIKRSTIPEKITEETSRLEREGQLKADVSRETIVNTVSPFALVFPDKDPDTQKLWTRKYKEEGAGSVVEAEVEFTRQAALEIRGKSYDKFEVKKKVTPEPTNDPKVKVKLRSQSSEGSALFDRESGDVYEFKLRQTMVVCYTVEGIDNDNTHDSTWTIKRKE